MQAARGKILVVTTVGLTAVLAFSLLIFVPPRISDKDRGAVYNTGRACPGYTLLAPIFSTSTFLLDLEGRLVNRWKSDYEPGQVAYLLENGHLLRTGSLARSNPAFRAGGGTGGRVQEFTWEGELVWDFEYSSEDHLLHHDVQKLPNGNLLMISWERLPAKQAIAAGRDPELQGDGELWPDFVIEVRPTGKTAGEIVWKWRVWDHLIQDRDSSKPNYGDVALHPERIDVNYGRPWTEQLASKELEKLKSLGYLGSAPGPKPRRGNPEWTHINAISYNPKLDQIALSVLGFDELWIIDHSTTTEEARGHTGGRGGKGGDLLYRWGNPRTYRAGSAADQRLFAQHNVHWIPPGLPGEGHLLVFNNGRHRPGGDYSSVDEIVPPVDTQGHYRRQPQKAFGPSGLAWSYTAPEKGQFYSMHISGAERLPNGNTLICSGATGTLFEVTKDGELVWKYVNCISRPASREPRPSSRAAAPRGGPGDDRPRRGGPPDEPTNTVFRAYRYAPDYPGLIGKSLKPGEKLENPAAQESNPRPRQSQL